jgi:hypothetical protein
MAEPTTPIAKLRDKLMKGEITIFDYLEAAKAGVPTPTQVTAPQAPAAPRQGLPDAPAATPKGRRPPGATGTGGLSSFYYLQDRGNSAGEAQSKAAVLEGEGGMMAPDEKGNITIQKKGYRAAPQSSTGRNYDPVAERKSMMANAAAAVAERKNLQASDQQLAEMQEAKVRTPGRISGFASEYGTGSAKELTAQEMLDRKPAMTPLSRKTGEMMPLRDEISILNKEQEAAGMPALGSEGRLDDIDKRRKMLLAQQSSKKSTPALTLPKNISVM